MNFFGLWLLLFGAFLVGTFAVVSTVTGHLDLRYSAFATTVLTAPMQALVLWWVLRPRRHPSRGRAARLKSSFLMSPFLLRILALDAVFLLVAWLPTGWNWADLGRPLSVPNLFAGLKGLLGGVLVLWMAYRRRDLGPVRPWIVVFGLGMLLFGLDYWVAWSRALPSMLFSGRSLLFRWLYTFVPIFAAAIFLLTRLAPRARDHSSEAATLLNWAAGLFWAHGLILLLSRYNLPFPAYPWPQLTASVAFLAMSTLWFSMIFLWIGDRGTSSRNLRS